MGLSISDLWVLYTCRDSGFVEFALMAADIKLQAIREAAQANG